MLREKDLSNLNDDSKCFVCGKEFESCDEIVKVFDKAFGKKVKIHKRHHFSEKEL